MRLLCIAAQGTPYGHVTVNGKPPSVPELARLLMLDDDPYRHRVRAISRLIAELERNGVADRGPCGCLVSRRMERDGEIAKIRRDAVNQRPDRAPVCARPAPDLRPSRARAAPVEIGQPIDEQQNSLSFVNIESTEAESERARDACLHKQMQSARASVRSPPKSSHKWEDLPHPSHAPAAASAPQGRAAAMRGSLTVVVNREDDDGTERLDH